nr:hypothetical protein [uncultured Prevotella sp.]
MYIGYSKSINAASAEHEGKYPASKAAKVLGVSMAALKRCMQPCEWHHTSCRYNHTDYYDTKSVSSLMLGEMKEYDERKKAERQARTTKDAKKIEACVNSGDELLMGSVAANPAITVEQLKKLVETGSPYTSYMATLNPNVTDEIKRLYKNRWK